MEGLRNRGQMDRRLRVFVDRYKHGRYPKGIGTDPEVMCSGQCDDRWYGRPVKSLRLAEAVTVARRTGDIGPELHNSQSVHRPRLIPQEYILTTSVNEPCGT